MPDVLSFHVKQVQSSRPKSRRAEKQSFCLAEIKSALLRDRTSIRRRNPQSMCGTLCPGILSVFLGGSLCESHAAVVWSDELSCGVSVCLSFSLPPPLLRFLSASVPGRQGKHVTLTGIKQDTALRQAQMRAGTSYFSVTPAASFLPVASLPGPASISLCASLPALSQEGARKDGDACSAPP